MIDIFIYNLWAQPQIIKTKFKMRVYETIKCLKVFIKLVPNNSDQYSEP